MEEQYIETAYNEQSLLVQEQQNAIDSLQAQLQEYERKEIERKKRAKESADVKLGRQRHFARLFDTESIERIDECMKSKKLSAADLGYFHILCHYLQYDTNILTNKNGTTMKLKHIAHALGCTPRNARNVMKSLHEANFIKTVVDEVGEECYVVNKLIAFKGSEEESVK